MYQLETFGGLALANGGRPRIVAHRRRLAFLTLVAAAGERGISRDKVLAFLWPETGENQARHNLEQLVYAIRSQLGEAVFGGTNPISLNPTVIGSDVDLFRQALSRGDRLARRRALPRTLPGRLPPGRRAGVRALGG